MALVSDTAMVMAAGMGKRMRPLTASQPKPLVRVAGKPLIDHTLDRLREAGVAKAVVNVHYLELLETGGGMIKARALLPDPFFCLNSDNIWLDGPGSAFHDLSRHWDAEKMDALLLLVPHARAENFKGKGDFHMDGEGRLRRRVAPRIAPFIYTGIQLVSHRLLREAPEGKFSTNILWSRAIEEGRLFGATFTGQWFEVGTPDAIAPTEAALKRG